MTQPRNDRGGSRGRRTRAEIEAVLNSPEAEAARAANPLVLERRSLYAHAAAGLLADLAYLGYHVEGVGRIKQHGARYDDAIPVLLRWLPRVRYLPLVQDILKTLTVPFARSQVAPLFVDLFRSPPEVEDPLRPDASHAITEDVRYTLGAGLAVFASPPLAGSLIELALARRYRWTRSQIVVSLPKTKDPQVPDVLLGLLDDPSVAAYAIEGLGKMKWGPAEERLGAFLDHEDWNTRTQAKKALKRLQTRTSAD